MNDTQKLLGKKIRELRKARNWTQEFLAEKIEINPKSLLRIETGKTFPTVQTLEKLANILNVEIGDLFKNHYLQDTSELKKYIHEQIENFDNGQIRSIYNFVYSIKL